jgi:hypothetical protein
MKQEFIKNQYDGPLPPARPLPSGYFSLDCASSDNASEIDAGIRKTIKGVRGSILAMGIGLAKIKAKGLYTDLHHRSMARYIESLCEQTKMGRSSIHNWLYIGEAYINYRKELDKIGFSDEDGLTKLPYVARALEAGEILYTTMLYDRDELRRFEWAAEKLKKELRGKQ